VAEVKAHFSLDKTSGLKAGVKTSPGPDQSSKSCGFIKELFELICPSFTTMMYFQVFDIIQHLFKI